MFEESNPTEKEYFYIEDLTTVSDIIADNLKIVSINSQPVLHDLNFPKLINYILTDDFRGLAILQKEDVLGDNFNELLGEIKSHVCFEIKSFQYEERLDETARKELEHNLQSNYTPRRMEYCFYSPSNDSKYFHEKVWELGVFIINNPSAQSSLVQALGIISKIFIWFKTFIFNGKKTENPKIKCKFIIKTMIGSSEVIREFEFEGSEKDYAKWERKQLKAVKKS